MTLLPLITGPGEVPADSELSATRISLTGEEAASAVPRRVRLAPSGTARQSGRRGVQLDERARDVSQNGS